LYSPLKLFFPVSALFFATGLAHYVYTYFMTSRFTNMSALMFTTSVLVFLIGLVSEQITQLIYRPLVIVDRVHDKRTEPAAQQQPEATRNTGT
jgi:hypothetical protein